MQIANPIYDIVFKYLMEDETIAKLIIGTIIGEEIVSLEFLPQENTVFLQHRSLTVYRLDFSAKIKLPDGGEKQVLIEIQKAKFATDIMRFRRYLGEQYQDEANSYLAKVDKNGKDTKDVKEAEMKRKALPIVTIYFLGYPLEHTTVPVIKVARHYYDVTTGEEIKDREEFIESLTHDSYVIQIPHLRPDHRSDVEQLLTIFDQRWVTRDRHILTVNEADYPEKYWQVMRRLQYIVVEPLVRRTMYVEDEILEELANKERELERKMEEKLEEKLEEELSKKLAEKDKELAEKLSEKDKTLTDSQLALAEAQRLIEELQQRLNQDL